MTCNIGGSNPYISFAKLVQRYRALQQQFFALPKNDVSRCQVFKNMKALEKKVDEQIQNILTPQDPDFQWLAR